MLPTKAVLKCTAKFLYSYRCSFLQPDCLDKQQLKTLFFGIRHVGIMIVFYIGLFIIAHLFLNFNIIFLSKRQLRFPEKHRSVPTTHLFSTKSPKTHVTHVNFAKKLLRKIRNSFCIYSISIIAASGAFFRMLSIPFSQPALLA